MTSIHISYYRHIDIILVSADDLDNMNEAMNGLGIVVQ